MRALLLAEQELIYKTISNINAQNGKAFLLGTDLCILGKQRTAAKNQEQIAEMPL